MDRRLVMVPNSVGRVPPRALRLNNLQTTGNEKQKNKQKKKEKRTDVQGLSSKPFLREWFHSKSCARRF